ncbi:MAG TPA: glycerol-3-phosphate acyltransferase [Acidimicrobiia bacterium]|nr:glycerol-3-phosphate acyltransferase [Acidimicrobiia bacterium]
MTRVACFVLGYLIGGIPTADTWARRSGIDLRAAGSANPGANNALRLGGRRLAAAVLATEVAKGALCVLLGSVLAGDIGMVLAGAGATVGNVLNPYRRFRGGQGLGISAGVLLAAVPIAGAFGLAVIAFVVKISRMTAPAALAALVAVLGSSVWLPVTPWGITDSGTASLLAAAIAVAVTPKQVIKLRRADRPRRRAPA